VLVVPLLFLDTETTSLRTDRQVWNIGVIRRDVDHEERHELIVSDVDLSEADPNSLAMNHFWDRHPRHGGNPGRAAVVEGDQAAELVEEWTRPTRSGPVCVVGDVPDFDTHCLAAMLRAHRRVWPAHYDKVDIKDRVVGWLAGSGWFDDWERFLAEQVTPLLPDGVLHHEHLQRLRGGRPLVEPDEAGEIARQVPHLDIGRLRTVLGIQLPGWENEPACPYIEPDPPYSSDALAAAVGVATPTERLRHTALGDADMVARLYHRVSAGMGLLGRRAGVDSSLHVVP
jgi:hypothetical protein